jgi:N-acetylglucosamine malate deacetylase 1
MAPSDPDRPVDAAAGVVGEQPQAVDLLAIGAHPDDVEYGMGGTLVRHHHAGHRIGVVDLTRGELGSKGTPELRADEAREAAQVYRASFRTCLDLGDNQVAHDPPSVHQLATVIRTARPRVVVSHHPEDRHPDHRSANELVRRAVFAAALTTLDLGVEHHVTTGLLGFPTDRVIDGDVYVDVTDVWAERLEAMRRFASQFTAPPHEIDRTLYGIDDYLEVVTTRARAHGQRIGVPYAEAFVTEQGVPADDLVALFDVR